MQRNHFLEEMADSRDRAGKIQDKLSYARKHRSVNIGNVSKGNRSQLHAGFKLLLDKFGTI